jgi:flagellar hook protein FlgE
MYSAISGMEANSTWLDVIGNNISNSNTTAYKSSAVSFSDSLSQTLSTGNGDESIDELGGVDPEQVGTGTRVQAITANWTQGTEQQTGIATDVDISGNGFLISKSGDSTFLTRAGNLTFDSTGNLVDANGGLIQGYTAAIQQTTTTIESAAGMGNANPLVITKSAFVLNDLDTSAISNININPNMTIPPAATTTMTFTGNLDAAQQAATGVLTTNNNGGVLQQFIPPVGAGNNEIILPTGLTAAGAAGLPQAGTVTYAAADTALNANGEFVQAANLSITANGPLPVVTQGVGLDAVVADDTGTYAWEQQNPPVTPALTSQETVYDSNGNARTVTIQMYQVNDLGAAGINAAAGPSQTMYAWYAFDTTGGAAVSTANLVGGTGIIEGEGGPVAAQVGYDRGVAGNQYAGDFLFFNTDGSLASTGGAGVAGGVAGTQQLPDIYLPALNPGTPAAPGVAVSPVPSTGAEITQISLNFGTAGVLGAGERNGLTGDAEGTYQTINGVNTYVPDSHSTVTQNGYADGSLTGIAFDATGKIQGTFSDGQTIALAQVAIATVENEGGLTNVGNNYYQQSVNSGAETIGLAGQNGTGTIIGGALEGSNVDLTVELSNMIIAQRGFEVNARVITVESQNLQTLTQLGQ